MIIVAWLDLEILSNTITLTNGKTVESAVYPDLYHPDEYPDHLEQHRPQLKKDDKVLVWDCPGDKRRPRHFSHWAPDGRINAFANGDTSFSSIRGKTNSWNYYEIVSDE